MDRIAKSFPRLLRFLATFGIYIAYIGMAFITVYLFKGLYNLIFIPDSIPVVSPIIPGIKIPGFFYIPFWYGIISLFVVIVIHEFSHGIAARLNNIKVKSSGVGMLAVIPLAFVEPDEKELSKKPKKQQLSVYSAGPFSNILTAFLILLISIFLISPLANSITEFKGIEINDIVEESPAFESELEIGDMIIGVDGITVNETNFHDLITTKKPGETVIFQTAEKNVTITPITQKEDGIKPYYGIFISSKIEIKESITAKVGSFLPNLLFVLIQFLNWLFVLSLGLGLANLLPLGPVDGGRIMLVSLLKFFSPEKAKKIWANISLIILLLLLINLAFPYLKKLIHPSL
jgi:membrane-associated protease RseP (regulator of RpoE activity)